MERLWISVKSVLNGILVILAQKPPCVQSPLSRPCERGGRHASKSLFLLSVKGESPASRTETHPSINQNICHIKRFWVSMESFCHVLLFVIYNWWTLACKIYFGVNIICYTLFIRLFKSVCFWRWQRILYTLNWHLEHDPFLVWWQANTIASFRK